MIGLLLLLAVAPACARKAQSLERPVSLGAIVWGGGLREIEEKLRAAGWSKSEAKDETVGFVLKADAIPEALRGEDPAFAFGLTLYFQKDKLVAFRMNRRDTGEALDLFTTNLRKDYALGEPAHRVLRPAQRTPAGNEMQDEVLIYANSDILVRIIRTRTKAAESRVAAGAHDEIETQVFSKRENPALTPDALRAND